MFTFSIRSRVKVGGLHDVFLSKFLEKENKRKPLSPKAIQIQPEI
jgi:hypothetical protein